MRSASLKLLPLLGTVAGGALLFPFLQVGPLFTLEPLAPKMDRLDPFRGLKRVFFELDNWTALLRTLLKLACVGAVCWSTVASQLPRILELSGLGLEAALACLAEAVRALLVRSLTCFVGLGVLDLVYQRWRFARRMRMTREEVKQEFKEDEGDPHAKQARRRMHEEIAQHSLVERARDADVIVVNPTHFACALRFRPEEDGAPRLIAKGADALAARLREVAREEDIPIVRDVRLARALYALELETEIPEDLYEAAIEVLRWVEEVARAEGWTPAWRGDPRKRDESD